MPLPMMMTIFPLLMVIYSGSWEVAIMTLPLTMVGFSLNLFSPMSTINPISPLFTLDSMSVMMIMLTLWISTLMLLASLKIKTHKKNQKKFLQTTLWLTLILIAAFSVNNLFSYYIFFEASLIPTLIMILSWGYQPERLEAGMYMMLYTMSASLPLIMAILYLHNESYTLMFFSPQTTVQTPIPIFLEASLMLAFLVKLPMYLTHLWLPKAHVEAPVAGSMILASILLKLGAYGLLRVGMMHSTILLKWGPLIMAISLWGAVMTSFLCIRQTDMKSMIAYSSVSHMALLITGVFTCSTWGWEGALVMMIAHGLSSSGLFALANMYYENSESRSLLINKGMLFTSPVMAMWWMLLIAANMAAPPTINMLAEVLLMISIISYALTTSILLFIISFLTACYSLVLYTSLHHGPPHTLSNPFKTIPLYHTVSILHAFPLFLLITCSSLLSNWM